MCCRKEWGTDGDGLQGDNETQDLSISECSAVSGGLRAWAQGWKVRWRQVGLDLPHQIVYGVMTASARGNATGKIVWLAGAFVLAIGLANHISSRSKL